MVPLLLGAAAIWFFIAACGRVALLRNPSIVAEATFRARFIRAGRNYSKLDDEKIRLLAGVELAIFVSVTLGCLLGLFMSVSGGLPEG